MGVELDAGQAERILAFGALLLRSNRAFNLISRKDQDRLYHRHLLDSLSLAPFIAPLTEGGRILDIGTGAGLPGVPLAIARPAAAFRLVDRSERKIRFVGRAVRSLGLDNVETVCGDAAQMEVAAYDLVVSRAVAGLAEIWALAAPRLRPGGRLLLMRHGQSGAGDVPAEDEASAMDEGSAAKEASADEPAAAEGCELPGASGVERVHLNLPGLPRPHGLLIVNRAR